MDKLIRRIRERGYSSDDLTVTEDFKGAIKVHPDEGIAPIYVTDSNRDILETRILVWNENQAEAIYVWNEENSGYLIDARVPPINSIEGVSESVHCPFPTKNELISGTFWSIYANKLVSKNRKTVDIHLVEALEGLLKQLTALNISTESAHGLIDRCLFAAFLDHRNLWNPRFNLANALESGIGNNVQNIFSELENRFNGDLSRSAKRVRLNRQIVETLNSVFGKTFYVNRQAYLYPYRFDLINVDLISSIFERFIEATSRWSNRESGTYYSPPQVAWRVVEQTMKPLVFKMDEDAIHNIRVLDPCCGSGVFIVHAYKYLRNSINSMRANNKQRPLGTRQCAKLMLDSIRGWDIEPTAIRIATFSLYLSLLEGQRTISESFKFPKLLDKVLFVRDGLLNGNIRKDTESKKDLLYPPTKDVQEEQYDVVIGNPPWGFKSFSKSYKDVLKERYPQPNKGSSSEAFVFKFMELVRDHGRVGIMVNSSVMANRTSRFWRGLEETGRLEKIVDLGEVHKILGFSTSSEKTSLLFFKNQDVVNGASATEFSYIAPKLTPFSSAMNMILFSQDQEHVYKLSDLNMLEKRYGVNLLSYLQASNMDRSLISRIFDQYGENKVIDAQKGGQILRGSTIEMPFKANSLYVLGHEKKDFSVIEDRNLRRSAAKSQRLPVLMRRHQKRGRLSVAVKHGDFTVLEDVLALGSDIIDPYALAAIFSSKLALYILKYLARQFGQRNQSYLDDSAVKLFPIPPLDTKESSSILKELSRLAKEVESKLGQHRTNIFDVYDYSPQLSRIDDLVYELFDLSYIEMALVESDFWYSGDISSSNDEKIIYQELLAELAEINEVNWNLHLGGMIQSVTTGGKPAELPLRGIPLVLAGGSFHVWAEDQLTVYRSNDIQNWNAVAAISDANIYAAKMAVNRIRKIA